MYYFCILFLYYFFRQNTNLNVVTDKDNNCIMRHKKAITVLYCSSVCTLKMWL